MTSALTRPPHPPPLSCSCVTFAFAQVIYCEAPGFSSFKHNYSFMLLTSPSTGACAAPALALALALPPHLTRAPSSRAAVPTQGAAQRDPGRCSTCPPSPHMLWVYVVCAGHLYLGNQWTATSDDAMAAMKITVPSRCCCCCCCCCCMCAGARD